MKKITKSAYAKINLGLDTVKKRSDGYHEVRMIMQNISLHDTLTLQIYTPDSENSVHFSNQCGEDHIWLHSSEQDDPDVPMDEHNLIYKAIKMLKDEFLIPYEVEAILTKRIPVAAGMAGGSTDAAAAFKGMNELCSLGLTTEELRTRAVRLGADIPYCIMGGTALSEGIGEILTPLPDMPDCHILIAKPPINVSTAYVYKNLRANELAHHPDIDGMVQAIHSHDLSGIIRRLENSLETVTIPDYPVISTIKNCMLEHGAAGALMSGSGPTVFGIYTDETAAQAAAQSIREQGLSEQVYITEPISGAVVQ